MSNHRQVPAIKVSQWLRGWDRVQFSAKAHRRKPPPHFFLFSLPAVELRSLCGIARRQTSNLTPRAADLGIQREHDPERSNEIARFVEYGYPWSTLSEAKRRSSEFNDLRKPGWLPTAIVVNILQKGDVRNQTEIALADIISLHFSDDKFHLILPYSEWSENWAPSSVPPLEVIDGQHRLWTFGKNSDRSFQLPVVAFHGLDISWQAYLFWTINIKPKRINPSLAFDLYPLLRAEDWLERGEGHSVYRETRSQELTEALWSHPKSPWYDRINMLGERQNPWVSQSAWIKSLMATLVRRWQGRGRKVGGLFGSRLQEGEEVLGWSRAQQAAFLIFAWQKLQLAIRNSTAHWANHLRTAARPQRVFLSEKDDLAFYGQHSLIVTDQGVRGYLHVLNDLCFVHASQIDLRSWRLRGEGSASDADAVSAALKSIDNHAISAFLNLIAEGLGTFDWRTSSTPRLSEEERRAKLVFRGSSGYKELRIQLLQHLAALENDIGTVARRLRNAE